MEAESAYALAAAAAERLTVPDGELLDVLEALGDVRYDLGDARADAAYRAARRRARVDPTVRARLCLKTARVCERAGRYPQALRSLSRGRTELAAAPQELCAGAAAMRAQLDARAARIRHMQGRDRDAVRWAESALAAANLAEVLVDQNRLVEAEENLRAAIRVWQAVGVVSEIAWGRLQLGRVDARAGRADDALAQFRSAREHFASHHEALEVLAVDAATAECVARAGRPDETLAIVDDALRRAQSAGGLVPALPTLHRARGVALLHRSDRAGAHAALLESLAVARARQAGHDVALALTVLLEHGLAPVGPPPGSRSVTGRSPSSASSPPWP